MASHLSFIEKEKQGTTSVNSSKGSYFASVEAKSSKGIALLMALNVTARSSDRTIGNGILGKYLNNCSKFMASLLFITAKLFQLLNK